MLKGAATALNFGRGTCKPYSISALFIVLLVLCPILWSAPIKWCISAARKHSLLFFSLPTSPGLRHLIFHIL